MKRGIWLLVPVAALMLVSGVFAEEHDDAPAANDYGDVEIQTIPIKENLAALIGAGGNIGVLFGEDGAIVIDDQFAPLSDKIKAAVAGLTDQPIRYIVNTHWHPDHTGGNETFAQDGAVVVAHENVRKRMSAGQFLNVMNTQIPPAPEESLPIVTFADAMTFYLNGEEVSVFHVKNAHTDGDAVIHFKTQNVIHAGDTLFNGMYPYIDVVSGGSIDGMIANADALLNISDEETVFIPGHGSVANRQDLEAYRDMLARARELVDLQVQSGLGRDAVVAAKPLDELDEVWGKGFLPSDVFAGFVFDSLTK